MIPRPENLLPEQETVDLSGALTALFRAKWLILSFTLLVSGMSFLVMRALPSAYETDALVQIVTTGTESYLSSQEFKFLFAVPNSGSDLGTQVEILKSDLMLRPIQKWYGIKIEDLRRKVLKISSANGLIKITVRLSNPTAAADLANALAKNYIEYYKEARIQLSREATERFLDKDPAQMSADEIMEKLENLGYERTHRAGALGRILETKQTQRERLAQLRVYYKDDHPQIVRLKDTIALTDRQLIDAWVEGARKWQQALNDKSLSLSFAQLVQPAPIPTEPVWPKRFRGFLAGTGAGFAGACVLILAWSQLFPKIKNEEDLITQTGLTFFGWLPRISGRMSITFRPFQKSSPWFKDRTAIVRNVLEQGLSHTPSSILITSVLNDEGKTTVAAALACSFAEVNQKVVIVDTDMRRPTIHKIFKGQPRVPGLSDYFAGKAGLEDILCYNQENRVTVISAGETQASPTNLFSGPAFGELIKELKTRFDRVILDSPPVIGIPEVFMIAGATDFLLLVVKAFRGEKRMIFRAVAQFERFCAKPITGTIMNFMEDPQERHVISHYYGK